MSPPWHRLFPAADFRLPIGLRPGNATQFWSRWDLTGTVLAERRRWLMRHPDHFAACLPEGELGQREALEYIQASAGAEDSESDWVLLSGDRDREPTVLAGQVVFPSQWSLPEKLGLPISAVHAPVPGLQKAIGPSIDTILARLQVGSGWIRENWGFSASDELNYHPSRNLPQLTAGARLETTWIRLETQFLTRLPQTQGVLFGIRVHPYRLDEVAAIPAVGERIAHALRTMPEAMVAYKGLSAVRPTLIKLLSRLPEQASAEVIEGQ